MIADDDTTLAELLCARLCHDLAGPVGAAAAGAELLEDCGDDDGETAGLVAASAAGAAARLKFFRSALGPAGSAQAALAVRDLAESYLRTAVSAVSPGITLGWTCQAATLDGDMARLALNLVLIGRDALTRGGGLDLEIGNGRMSMVIAAETVALGDEVRAVLVEGREPSGPRGAQAFFARKLSMRLGGRLDMAEVPTGVRVSFVPSLG
jgi:histidine phosphotransferase ChpT